MRGWLVGLVLLTGCIMEPKVDGWGIPYEPLPIYRQWWAEMEACSGLHGRLDRVAWSYYPDTLAVVFETPWGKTDGIYSHPDEAIMVVRGVIDKRRVIAHEMLHALRHAGGHPPVFARCGV